LPKLFDSLAKLKFEGNEDSPEGDLRQASDASMGNTDVKVAVGMHSKDFEYVEMAKPCDCSGQVVDICGTRNLFLLDGHFL